MDAGDRPRAPKQALKGSPDHRAASLEPYPAAADPSAKDWEVVDATQRARALLLERHQQGERFEALARENSEDPSAGQGGDLGWIGLGLTDAAFEKAAFAAAKGGGGRTGPLSVWGPTSSRSWQSPLDRERRAARATRTTSPDRKNARRARRDLAAGRKERWSSCSLRWLGSSSARGDPSGIGPAMAVEVLSAPQAASWDVALTGAPDLWRASGLRLSGRRHPIGRQRGETRRGALPRRRSHPDRRSAASA